MSKITDEDRQVRKERAEARREARRVELQAAADPQNSKLLALFSTLITRGYPATLTSRRHMLRVIKLKLWVDVSPTDITPEYLTAMAEIAQSHELNFRLAKSYHDKSQWQLVGRFSTVSESDDDFDEFDDDEDF